MRMLFAAALVSTAACASGGGTGSACLVSGDCPAGEVCIDERCVLVRGTDGGARDTSVEGDAERVDAEGVDAAPRCDCDDDDACTIDECDAATGRCAHTPRSCEDGDACTADACDPLLGCTHDAIVCDDGDACTADSCDVAMGCRHEPIVAGGDVCGAAIDVSAGGVFSGSLACATDSVVGACGAGAGGDAHHVLMLTAPRRVRASVTGDGAPVLAIGATCGTGNLACGSADLLLDAGTYFLTVDAGSGAPGAYTLRVELLPFPSPETVSFPLASDPRVASSNAFYWRTGDYVEGFRNTTLPRARRAVIGLAFASNALTCDTLPMRARIDGVEVGTFTISPGTPRVDATFSFSAITGPGFTLRYETIRQVASGCGSVSFDEAGSTVRLEP
ncbi:MAG: hypothetical protein KF901_31685 [Myxococcales bacterium]|nr:hypothetical protein [Myxococcales bacterium]